MVKIVIFLKKGVSKQFARQNKKALFISFAVLILTIFLSSINPEAIPVIRRILRFIYSNFILSPEYVSYYLVRAIVYISIVASILRPYFLVAPVYAEAATSSAMDNSPRPTSSEFLGNDSIATATAQIKIAPNNQSDANPFFDAQSTNINPVVSFSDLLKQSLEPSFTASGPSLKTNAKAIIGSVSKKSFKMNEQIRLRVDNAPPQDLQVVVLNSSGVKVENIDVSEQEQGTGTDIILTPSSSLRPGKYSLSVTDSTGTTTTQDFTWGVLAINTNKSIYVSGEEADLAMAVLDERGNMVCDANVTLNITDPLGKTTTLTTSDKSITVNPQCLSHAFSLTPDYEAHYKVVGAGQYSVALSATTQKGTYTIDDSFAASDSVPYDVERVTATRIYPYYSYPVTFNIVAKQDFQGKIVEYVPSSFEISPYASGSAAVSYNSTALPNQYTSMQEAFGVPNLSLGLPFSGNYSETQGFGVALTDPEEAAYYATFGLAGHDGLDFALPYGTPVVAADSGTVVLAGLGTYGITVAIDHPWGRSYYGHLDRTSVRAGDTVSMGQLIGYSGNSGYTTGAHLHFGIKPKNATIENGYWGKVDPSPFLGLIQTGSQVLGATNVSDGAKSKIIAWDVTLKRGENIVLGYNFKAPPQSPQLYTLGPLSFFDNNNNMVFQEARRWLVAVDADSSVGPTDCKTGANVTGVGTIDWTNPGNACDSNASNLATISLTGTAASHYLQGTMGTNQFSIASNAVIKGIVASITRTGSSNGSNHAIDNSIKIVQGGSILGNEQSAGATWNAAGETATFGSSSNLWGLSWTATQINATNFGVAISAAGSSGSGSKTITPSVNQISLTVYYNTPPNTPTNDSPADTSTGVSVGTTLQMHATDDGSDTIKYDLLLYSASSSCTGTPTEFDQTSSGTGWDNGTNAYASGATATLTPGTLSGNTTYSWKVRAIDPSGSNTYGSYSTCTSFTTGAAGPTLGQLMRHGAWFSGGAEQPFTF